MQYTSLIVILAPAHDYISSNIYPGYFPWSWEGGDHQPYGKEGSLRQTDTTPYSREPPEQSQNGSSCFLALQLGQFWGGIGWDCIGSETLVSHNQTWNVIQCLLCESTQCYVFWRVQRKGKEGDSICSWTQRSSQRPCSFLPQTICTCCSISCVHTLCTSLHSFE